MELADALRISYQRIQQLDEQEQEEFTNWVKSILLMICGNKEAVVEEILGWVGNGEEDLAYSCGKNRKY